MRYRYNGSLLCWGNNNGFQALIHYTPGIVDVGTNIQLSASLDTDTACALLSTGEISVGDIVEAMKTSD